MLIETRLERSPIMENQHHYLSIGLSYAYSHCIDRYLAALTHPLFSSLSYLDEETATLAKEVETIYLSLPSLLSENVTIKATYVQKLIDLRPILEQKYRTLTAYERELTHLTLAAKMTLSPSMEDKAVFEANLNQLHNFDFQKLADDCTDFVFQEKNLHRRHEHAALLLPYVPIRLTKDNFIYYMGKSLKQIRIEDTAESATFLTDILTELFEGTQFPQYGQHFKDIATSLTELKEMSEREEFEENVELLQETLEGSLDLVEAFYEVICALCTFFLLEDSSFKVLTDLHPSFYDLYYSVKTILEGSEDKELFASTLPERVEEITASLEKSYLKACQKATSSPLFSLLQTTLQMRLDYVFGFDMSPKPLTLTQAAPIFETFLIKLRERLDHLSNVERKLRMQSLMGIVPFVMSEETFHTYMVQAFHSTKESHSLLVAVMYLTTVLEQCGYYGEPTEEEHILLEDEPFL